MPKHADDRPESAILQEEGNGDAIRVTDEMAASGRKSLRVADAPGLEHVFNPHFYYQPRYRRGRAVLTFDVRLEPGAVFAHEWRDASQPYRVGPSMRIAPDGQLHASGKPLAKVPIGQWIHVELTCNLGRSAAGKYRLVVTSPNQPPQTFASLPCGSAEFKRLEWLGFVSLASDKTAFYLDNIELAPPTAELRRMRRAGWPSAGGRMPCLSPDVPLIFVGIDVLLTRLQPLGTSLTMPGAG